MLNLKHFASHAYRQYELVTCVNMLEPWEKKLISEYRYWETKPTANPDYLPSIRWILSGDAAPGALLQLHVSSQLHANPNAICNAAQLAQFPG